MKRIKIFFSTGLLLSVFVLYGLQAISYYRFRDVYNRFDIELPRLWEIVKSPKAALIAGAPRDGDPFSFRPNVNLIIDVVEEDVSLDELFAANLSFAQSMLKQFHVLEIEEISLDGVPAKRAIYRCNLLSKGITYRMQNTVYCLLDKKHFYILTGSSLEEQYDDYSEVFDRIGSSLRVF